LTPPPHPSNLTSGVILYDNDLYVPILFYFKRCTCIYARNYYSCISFG